ncbi:MAG: sulfotransferase domain-containing protein [Pseudomonadota bacterium]
MTNVMPLPNFLIPGAPKAGTSSMQRWIADHPDALGSIEKETYFLVDPGTHMYRPDKHISQGLSLWHEQFPIPSGASPKVILESTPAYLYAETALREVPKLPTAPKCLFILREPGAQIHSLYTYFRDNWDWVPSNMSFANFLEHARNKTHDFKGNELAAHALEYGSYVDYLEPWAEALGEDRLRIATFDQLKADPKSLVRDISTWLGLDPTFYDTYAFPKENETYAPRNKALQALNVKVRQSLPKGRLYNAARSLYRRLNTTSRALPMDEEAEVLAKLSQSFAPANRRLSARFNVDLAGWPV